MSYRLAHIISLPSLSSNLAGRPLQSSEIVMFASHLNYDIALKKQASGSVVAKLTHVASQASSSGSIN